MQRTLSVFTCMHIYIMTVIYFVQSIQVEMTSVSKLGNARNKIAQET